MVLYQPKKEECIKEITVYDGGETYTVKLPCDEKEKRWKMARLMTDIVDESTTKV